MLMLQRNVPWLENSSEPEATNEETILRDASGMYNSQTPPPNIKLRTPLMLDIPIMV